MLLRVRLRVRLLQRLLLSRSGRLLIGHQPCAWGKRSRRRGYQLLPVRSLTMRACIGGQIAAFDAVNTGQELTEQRVLQVGRNVRQISCETQR